MKRILAPRGFLILALFPFLALAEMPDFYGEALGVVNRSGTANAPNEVIDPFSGTLNLTHNDVVIPGNGGLDIVVKRVYSSQSVYARSRSANFQLDNALGRILQMRSPFGVGWTMHMGRIRMSQSDFNSAASCNYSILNNSNENNPTIETSDGQQRIFFCNDYSSTYGTNAEFVTKDHWVANKLSGNTGFEVIDTQGTKYTMNYRLVGGTQPGSGIFVWYTTRIEDKHGNYLTITYDSASSGENALISRIQASDGRRVDFAYTNRTDEKLVRLATIKSSGRTWTYSFVKIPSYTDSSNRSYYQLSKVDLPGSGTGDWEYKYYNRATGAVGDNMLEKVTYPYGGTTTYDYRYHCFISQNCWTTGRNNSIVIKSKVNGGRVITAGSWSYTYSGSNTHDTTTIQGPTKKEVYKHYGLWGTGSDLSGNPINYGSTNAGLWRIGLLIEKQILTTGNTLLQKEEYDYDSRKIANEYYSRVPYTSTRRVSDPDVFSAYVTEKRIIQEGKTYTTKYENFSDNINPHKITEIGQATRVKTLDYYPRIDGQNIVGQVDDEQFASATNRKITRTFDSDGNLKTENQYGVLTTYGYDGQGNITWVKDARNKITRYGSYYRGVPRSVTQPEGISITRTVDTFGNTNSVNNGRGYTTSYNYDSINRLTGVTYPFGSAASIVWNSSGRTLNRGSFTQTATLDGFGREICTKTENIYVGEAFNAVGNRTYETYPNFSSCTSSSRTSFTYDALDRIKRTTHADGQYNEIVYQNNNVQRLRDERGKLFYNTYRSYSDPDSLELIKLTGPESLNVNIGRNVLGQVTSVNRNGVNRTFNHGSTIFLKTETNPETGTTTYGRDAVGNMTSKKVGSSGTTIYTYDDINRLKFTSYPSGTPDVAYTYDKNNNVKTVNSGIANLTYTYDSNDNLSREQHRIDGKNYYLTYAYTALDHLNTVTYADNGTVSYAPNDLGWPTKAAPYVTNVAYDAFGRPTSFAFANGRTRTQSYWARGWPRRTIVNGGISDRERSYDASGNLMVLDDRLDNAFDRSMTYDGLNRLKTANGAWGTGAVNYSSDDDITSKRMGTKNLTYAYNASNKVSSISGFTNFITPATYSYDAYGNVTRKSGGGAGWNYDYDDASNLRKVLDTDNAVLREYDYSGHRQRVRSIKSDETRIHVVSQQGQIMNEFVTTGSDPNITNVYLGNRLVAELENRAGPLPPATIFGWGYGNSANKTSYSTSFTINGTPDKVKICVDGYGISYATEVRVSVNGVFIGYMKPGGDPTETCFELSGTQVREGSNTIVFTQAISGQTWGVGGKSASTIIRVTQISDAGFLPAVIILLLGDEEETPTPTEEDAQ